MVKLKSQVSLELAVSLVVILVLFFGTLQVFLWVNNRLVRRQQDYETGRVPAGSTNSTAEQQVNESSYPKLNIFGQ